jgi:hypothetical protein
MYYLGKNGQQTGPFSIEQLQSMAASGQVAPSDMLWAEGMSEWAPASSIAGIFAAPQSSPVYSTPGAVRPMPGAAQTMPAPFTGGQIPNYLWQSIVCTLCCCLPFGIAAIVFSTQVNSKLAAGDIAGAQESSRKAKMWCWLAFGIGIVVTIISVGIQIAAGIATATSQ